MTTKSISINEDHFKLKHIKPKTQKLGGARGSGVIRFKKPLKNKTVSRDKILNFIRQKQNEKPATNDGVKNEGGGNTTPLNSTALGGALEFFSELKTTAVPTTTTPKSHNQTLKTYSSPIGSVGGVGGVGGGVVAHNQLFKQNTFNVDTVLLPPIQLAPVPLYGVLKGGKLPTYRQYVQRLQSSFPQKPPHRGLIHQNKSIVSDEPRIGVDNNHITTPFPITTETQIPHKKVNLDYKKQKKTIRRTFRVGRSKHQRNIGVIINNKTIRNECSTKKHLLKQTTINEVKQFLLKKGLIKIGTTAPNDVLRKMYETANLICGDVHNHNSDILLHNYFNNA